MEKNREQDLIQEAGIVGKYSVEAMKRKVETLSDENKSLLGTALNDAGISFLVLNNMLEYLNEEKKQELSVLLGDLRMNVSPDATKVTIKSLTEFFKAN